MVIMLCIYGTVLFAQENYSPLEPLVSKPIIGYALLVQPPLTCQCLPTHSPLKKNLPPKKQGPVLSLDIPISPFWDTVSKERIQNRTIQLGGSATSWRETVMFGGWPIPRVIFAAPDFRTVFEGGIMKTLDVSPARTMEQNHVVLEGAVWYGLVGADGFFGQEQILRAGKSVNFETDFIRRSHGRQNWFGVKLGDFNRSFVVGRYGRGYAWTEGEIHFNVPGIDGLDWFPLYSEEFRTVSFSVEGKAKAKWISQSAQFSRVEYERVTPSPDPLRFGENHLEDRWLRTETEVIPFSHARFLRGVMILTKDYRGQNRLMFTNDYSSVRVLLRLSFN